MKRKIPVLLICFLLVLQAVILPASAATPVAGVPYDALVTEGAITRYATPAGMEAPNASKLYITTSTPADWNAQLKKAISIGLSASTLTKNKLTYTTDEEKAISDISMGFSMIGANDIQNAGISALVDGKWTTEPKTFFTKKLYNLQGEVLTGEKVAGDGYRYTSLYTFNFGKSMKIEGLGYLAQNNNCMPQAADLYASDDGKNWTLVGYYDRLHDRAGFDGAKDFVGTNTATAYPDAYGNYYGSGTNGRIYYLGLNEAVNAQYFRIAATTIGLGVANSGFVKTTTDAPYIPGQGASALTASLYSMPEILVFGENVPVIEATGIQTRDGQAAGTKDARFVATVKTAALDQATKITFRVEAKFNNGTEQTVTKDYDFTTVYTSFTAAGVPQTPPDGSVFALFDLTGIPEDLAVTFNITPIITYQDATTAVGQTKTVTYPVA